MQTTSAHEEEWERYGCRRWVAGMQCQGCMKHILGLVYFDQSTVRYEDHYPIGKPDDGVAEEIPGAIAEDFSEALRCQWVESYRACVVMCRRAIQTSAIEKNAQGGTLVQQIEDLATKGIITKPLKDFAHEIRLTGNLGAHADGLQDVVEEDAAAIVEFTREYLDHVYVLPERLKARRPQTKTGTANP